jgi:hypothetical protein
LKNTSQLHSGNCWRPSRNTKRKNNKALHPGKKGRVESWGLAGATFGLSDARIY